MTEEHRKILARIDSYSDKVLGDIDPQKVQVSVQIEKLLPIFEEISKELNMSLEDFFILYMDIRTEASCASQKKLSESLSDINSGEGMPILFR